MKITATIITLNEERNIARAIESLRCCDEILIVDSGSVDRTVELAEKLGARVIEAGWLGFAAQKNRAAEQASHDWILSLDADEALSEGLEAEIWNLQEERPAVRRLYHAAHGALPGPLDSALGLVPRPQVRLYDRGRRNGPAISSTRASGRAGAWATWRATSCTLPASRFPSTSRPWTATPRWPRRSWPRAR